MTLVISTKNKRHFKRFWCRRYWNSEMDYKGYKTQHRLSEGDRIVTQFEEQVIRLCHHDFSGLTQEEAAEQLQCSQGEISRAIGRLKLKAPQLFPILTEQQAFIRDCIIEEGLTHQQIAIFLNISESTVASTVATLKEKGVCFEQPHKTLQYENWMDTPIKHRI